MEIEIREISLNEIDKVFPIYGEVFGEDRLEIWRKRWKWEFIDNPRTELTSSKMWVAENERNKIVGFIASLPMLIKVGNNEILTSSSGDLLVAKAGRRQGLGGRLSKVYLDSTERLATDGFGYQPVTGHMYRKLGYQPVDIEPVYVRPFNYSSIYQFLLDSGRLPKMFNTVPFRPLLNIGCKIFNKTFSVVDWIKWPKLSKEIIIETVDEVGVEFDELWKSISSFFPVVCVRDSKFVKWRFIDDPVFNHDLLVARDLNGKVCGYIDVCITIRRKMVVGRIMDLFCNPLSVDVIDSLLCEALKLMKSKNVAIASCMGMHPLIRRRIKKCLYFRAKNSEIPALLYCKDEEIKKMIYDQTKWHVTSADGDEGFAA